jgi:HEAT repeat protein
MVSAETAVIRDGQEKVDVMRIRSAHVAAILALCVAGCGSKSDSGPVKQDRASRIAAMVGQRPSDGGAELVQALGDTDPAVRKAAAYALSSCLTEEIRPALVQATRDSQSEVRASAVVTVSLYNDKQAAKSLAEILTSDADESVRALAASGLGMNQSPEAIVALMENAEKNPSLATRRRAMKYAMARFGLRFLQEVDPLSSDWAGMVENLKDQKPVQDAYAACNVSLQRRPQDMPVDQGHDAFHPGHGAK